MRCMRCGRHIADEAEFCPHCGHSTHGKEGIVRQRQQRESDSRTVLAVIAVVVALVVIMAVVFFTMILGFSEHHTTPTTVYDKTYIDNGVKITINAMSISNIPWDDVKIRLTDGTNFAYWSPDSRDLDDEPYISKNLTLGTLGLLNVTCMVCDTSGNGCVDRYDYFTLTTCDYSTDFSSKATYRTVLIYEPTGMLIGSEMAFTG